LSEVLTTPGSLQWLALATVLMLATAADIRRDRARPPWLRFVTDSYSWRWVFLINVPVGLLDLGACTITLRDPDYLAAQRMELRRRPLWFDGIGLSLLVIVIVCWEVMLSKG
jgi:hypothetical protein